MKKWPILLFLFLAYESKAQILVSGFDDNLRQSENIHWVGSFRRFFLMDDEPYSGMGLLYKLMQKRSQDKKIFILTGMPSLFRSRTKTFLEQEKFPEHELILRNILTDWPTQDYKLKYIDQWMNQYQTMILIKDQSDVSLDLGRVVREKYQARLLRFYARVTSSKTLPPDVTPYYTPVDIAYGEMVDGRLEISDFDLVLDHLLKEENDHRIIPTWSYSPHNYDPCPQQPSSKCLQFALKIHNICQSRKEKT